MKLASPPPGTQDFEAGYRWLFDHSPLGVLVCDLQSNILQHNPSCETLLGYPDQALIGQPVSVILAPADQKLWGEQASLLGQEKIANFEMECNCIHQNGRQFWVHFWTSLMPAEQKGQPRKIVSLIRTIARRKAAEMARDDLFAETNDLIQSIGPDGRLLYVNRAWCDTLGYSQDEIHAINVFQLIHPDSQPHCAQVFGRLMQGENTGLQEITFVAKDGRRVELEGNLSPKMENGAMVSTRGIFRDISERKLQQAKAAEREERFRMLVEATANLRFFITNPERNRWFYISPAMREFWGLPLDAELDDLQVTSIDRNAVVPEDQKAYLERAESERRGEPVDLTYRLAHSRLGERWTRTRTRGVTQADGSVRVYGVSEDITSAKLAQAALAEREERFRMLVEFSSGMHYFITDPERSTWFYMSESSSAFLGLDPDQLGSDKQLIHHLIQRVLPEDRPIFLGQPDRERGGELVDIAYRVNHRSLGLRWVRTRTRGVTQADGSVRVYGVSEDITDSRRIQEALQRGEEQFRTIVEAAPNGIVLVDEQGIIRQVNAQLERDTGYRRHELLGQPVELLVPAHLAEAHPAHRQQYVKSPQDRPMGLGRELHVRHKQGSEFAAEIALSPIHTPDGNMTMATVVDVSSRKEAERNLQMAMDRLSRTNEELEQFAYATSHDLQEPLRAISGCLQIIERRYRGKLDAEADELIGHVVSGASRMKGLIDDMLSFTRVAHGEVQLVELGLEQILQTVLSNLRVAIAESGAVITHEPLPSLLVDPTQMTLLLQNLISNALKFHGRASPKIHISAKHERNGWKIGVHDNGIGIAPEFLDRVFGMFKRLHSREEFEGSGIGLAICKKIAERHGGRIWVESVPKQGSSFFIAFPD